MSEFKTGDRVSLISKSCEGTVIDINVSDCSSPTNDDCILVKFDDGKWRTFRKTGSCFGQSSNAHIKKVCASIIPCKKTVEEVVKRVLCELGIKL